MFNSIKKLIMVMSITILLCTCSSAVLNEDKPTVPHAPSMAEQVLASRSSTPWAITEAKSMLAEIGEENKPIAELSDTVKNAVLSSLFVKVRAKTNEFEKIREEKYADASCDIDYKDIKQGDVILTVNRNPIVMACDSEDTFHHAALCVRTPTGNDDETFIAIVGTADKVSYISLNFIREHDDMAAVLRYDGITDEQIDIIVKYAANQIGKSYNTNFTEKRDENKFYCSSLVWRAYQEADLEIDYNADSTDDFDVVFPSDIYKCDKMKVIKWNE